MFQKDLFKDQVALVTGGGSGIGYAIAEQLLTFGASVWIAGRKEERLQQARKTLAETGPCRYTVCDIRNRMEVETLAEDIQAEHGRLDLLINNAGGQFPALAEDISENGWNAVINTNLNGTWNVTQVMAQTFFIPQKSGSIVNIIANIYRGFPGMAHTGAARAGVDNLTKSLAVEWSKYHIRVNAVAPGIIQSTGLDNYPPPLLEGLSQKIPLKRLGTTQEVAWITLFLAGPTAAFITGETVYIDGGQRLSGDVFAV